MSFPFNVRVYGILCNSWGEILLCDELINGREYTKFPGGGLEFGEGTLDCIRRECREELNINIEIISHFYTTDFFVESLFNRNHQVISIYYLIEAASGSVIESTVKPYFSGVGEGNKLSLRWFPVGKDLMEQVNLPIDKKVCELLLRYYSV